MQESAFKFRFATTEKNAEASTVVREMVRPNCSYWTQFRVDVLYVTSEDNSLNYKILVCNIILPIF
jgi:hypothetical protein